jgi:Zn-dependent peptidase ImmA (M78 family)
VIAVNRKDPPTRRTFSLLHEFAHLMVRISGVSDLEADAKRPPKINESRSSAITLRRRL